MKADRPAWEGLGADDGINKLPSGSTCLWSSGTLKRTVHCHVLARPLSQGE